MSEKKQNKEFLGFIDPNWTDEEIAEWIVEAVERSRAEAQAARESGRDAPDDESAGGQRDPSQREPETRAERPEDPR